MSGRVYIVSGGTRGLGFATAQRLVAEGGRVVVSGRTAESVTTAAEKLGGPTHAAGVVADNADATVGDILTGAAQASFGRLDGVLISTGGPAPGRRWTSPTTNGPARSSHCSSARSGSPGRRPGSCRPVALSGSCCHRRSSRRSASWPCPTASGPAWPWPRRHWRTSWDRSASGCWGSCPAGSRRRVPKSWTPGPPAGARRPRTPSRSAATATPTSSGASPRSSSPRLPRT